MSALVDNKVGHLDLLERDTVAHGQYVQGDALRQVIAHRSVRPVCRGLHSSRFRLNVSTFCGIRWVYNFPPVY
jgi:hypothetical protein